MEPLAIVRSFYSALARGDAAGVLGALHADLAWTEAEGFPYYSGTWRTPQDVLERLLVPLSRDWEDFAATPEEFAAEGRRVITFGAYSGRARATGTRMRAPFVHRWEIRDGRIARFDMWTDTLIVWRALHGPGPG